MRISDWSSDVCSSDLDRSGLPHSELTLYACTANQIHSPKTARAYLREIVAYASWAETHPIVLRQNWQLLGSVDNVRSMFSFFLTEEMKCVIAIGKDACGFDTRRIEPTWGTRRRQLGRATGRKSVCQYV